MQAPDPAILADLRDRKRHRRIVTSLVAVATLGAGIAAAAPTTKFKSGDTLSALALNTTLEDFDNRLAEASRPKTFGLFIKQSDGCVISPSTTTWATCSPGATGVSNVKIASTTFRSIPACTVSSGSDIACSVKVDSSTSATVRCFVGSGASSSLVDAGVYLICTETQL